jgi:hypothetical protein
MGLKRSRAVPPAAVMTRFAPASGCHRPGPARLAPECRHSRTSPRHPHTRQPARGLVQPADDGRGARVRGEGPGGHGSLQSGYPRFVVHPFARRLAEVLAEARARGPDALARLVPQDGRRAPGAPPGPPGGVRRRAIFAATGSSASPIPSRHELAQRAKLYLQNIGGFISSREAEDRLAALGSGPLPGAEETFKGDAAADVKGILRPSVRGRGRGDLLLANSGMNAIHAAFRRGPFSRPRGRTAWVQLGWLYLDTIAILRKFTASKADYIHVRGRHGPGALERVLEARGPRIAGLMAEVPTNPLVQTPTWRPWRALPQARGQARPRPLLSSASASTASRTRTSS